MSGRPRERTPHVLAAAAATDAAGRQPADDDTREIRAPEIGELLAMPPGDVELWHEPEPAVDRWTRRILSWTATALIALAGYVLIRVVLAWDRAASQLERLQ